MQSAALKHGVRAKSRRLDVAPALKAVNLSALGDAFGGATSRVNRLAQDAGVQRKSARDQGAEGFSGGGGEIPYRSEMEQSFGRDLSHVRAHTGAPARKASAGLGAEAYTMGSDIAFKSANPSKSLVAHELTHVVQQTEGPSYYGGDGIDTSGEAEAERVESAVAAGRSASSALSGATTGKGPARKKGKRGPARKEDGFLDKFTMGMQFSKDGFEKSYEYTIWDKSISTPIPAAPFLNLIVKPSVKVAAKGGADWGGDDAGTGKALLEVSGSVGVGLSGGIANVAEVYGVLEPGLFGSAEFRFGNGGKWGLDVGVAVKLGGKIGVECAGGLLDYAFQLFELELFKFTGLNWDQDGFHKEKIGFALGKDFQDIIDAIKAIVDKAKAMGSALKDGAVKTGKYVGQKAKDAYDFITSW